MMAARWFELSQRVIAVATLALLLSGCPQEAQLEGLVALEYEITDCGPVTLPHGLSRSASRERLEWVGTQKTPGACAAVDAYRFVSIDGDHTVYAKTLIGLRCKLVLAISKAEDSDERLWEHGETILRVIDRKSPRMVRAKRAAMTPLRSNEDLDKLCSLARKT